MKCGHCEVRAGAGPPRIAQMSGGAQDTWWRGALGRTNSHSLSVCVCVCTRTLCNRGFNIFDDASGFYLSYFFLSSVAISHIPDQL